MLARGLRCLGASKKTGQAAVGRDRVLLKSPFSEPGTASCAFYRATSRATSAANDCFMALANPGWGADTTAPLILLPSSLLRILPVVRLLSFPLCVCVCFFSNQISNKKRFISADTGSVTRRLSRVCHTCPPSVSVHVCEIIYWR